MSKPSVSFCTIDTVYVVETELGPVLNAHPCKVPRKRVPKRVYPRQVDRKDDALRVAQQNAERCAASTSAESCLLLLAKFRPGHVWNATGKDSSNEDQVEASATAQKSTHAVAAPALIAQAPDPTVQTPNAPLVNAILKPVSDIPAALGTGSPSQDVAFDDGGGDASMVALTCASLRPPPSSLTTTPREATSNYADVGMKIHNDFVASKEMFETNVYDETNTIVFVERPLYRIATKRRTRGITAGKQDSTVYLHPSLRKEIGKSTLRSIKDIKDSFCLGS